MQRPENSAAPPSKQRRLTSKIWNDFDRVETDGEHRAICKHCQRDFSGSSKSGTTHLKNHLKRCSAIKSEESCKEMISPSQTGDLKYPIVIDRNSVFDEEKSSLDVVRMIIKHGYPLNMIEHERFSIFVENLQPRFKLPSRDTLKAGILRVYGEEKEKLRKYFEMLSCCFHLILSFLTCHGKKNRYCCFTLQFSEDGLKLKKKILALKSLENNHTGETLCETVKGLLLEWKINKKLCTVTVEHSSSNNNMVHNLITWLDHQGYPPHKRKLFHIPCITHIINLLVEDGLDEIVHILHKIRKAIKYLSETANGAQKFQEVDLTSQRWDSVFFMLQSALKYKEIFPYQQSGATDFPINISMEEWESAKAILECLTFFYGVVQRFLGSKCFITNLYFCDICNISKFLLNWQKSKQALICSIANKMRVRFDSYCIHFTRVSAIAAVFDPRTKLDLVLYSLKDAYGEGTKICSTIKDDIVQIFDGYAEDFSSQPLYSSSYGNNDFDVLRKWYKSKRDSQRAELNQYLQEPLVTNRELDILGWWHTNGKKFPTLWRMARDILAIPMSTSISNSAFYIEPMTINSIFNGLDPDIIEASTCGGDWLDNPIRITPNKDNDHSPEPTYSPSVFAGTSSSLETQEA
uniref:BED-type domain-containing protein n=1 Tax=Quercus lobata TaxID=97700 RepID=A0A7N2MTB6_QUELO